MDLPARQGDNREAGWVNRLFTREGSTPEYQELKFLLHRKLLDSFELPTELPPGVSARTLVKFMTRDKKARHDLTLVLDGPDGVEVVPGVPQTDILGTLVEMGCAP